MQYLLQNNRYLESFSEIVREYLESIVILLNFKLKTLLVYNYSKFYFKF